jgi:pimeloyl-ACP methyl ester carboxylesterase
VVVPTADTEKLATIIKNNQLVIVDKSGHLPQEEQPGVFADAVIKWVKATKLP